MNSQGFSDCGATYNNVYIQKNYHISIFLINILFEIIQVRVYIFYVKIALVLLKNKHFIIILLSLKQKSYKTVALTRLRSFLCDVLQRAIVDNSGAIY